MEETRTDFNFAFKVTKKDLRRTSRYVLNDLVEISWSDERGDALRVSGRCKDISANGMRFTTNAAPPLRSYVSFRVTPAQFAGSGSVRSLRRTNSGTEIGLEFTGGLKFAAAGMPDLKVVSKPSH